MVSQAMIKIREWAEIDLAVSARHLLSRLADIRQWCWDQRIVMTRQGVWFIFECENDKMRFRMAWS